MAERVNSMKTVVIAVEFTAHLCRNIISPHPKYHATLMGRIGNSRHCPFGGMRLRGCPASGLIDLEPQEDDATCSGSTDEAQGSLDRSALGETGKSATNPDH